MDRQRSALVLVPQRSAAAVKAITTEAVAQRFCMKELRGRAEA
jgi:hypothetical protein